jgi:hypothetical protein
MQSTKLISKSTQHSNQQRKGSKGLRNISTHLKTRSGTHPKPRDLTLILETSDELWLLELPYEQQKKNSKILKVSSRVSTQPSEPMRDPSRFSKITDNSSMD